MCCGEACQLISYIFEWDNGSIIAAEGQDPDHNNPGKIITTEILEQLKGHLIPRANKNFVLDLIRKRAEEQARRKRNPRIIATDGSSTLTWLVSTCTGPGDDQGDCVCLPIVGSKPVKVEPTEMEITIVDLPGAGLPGKYETFSVTIRVTVRIETRPGQCHSTKRRIG